MKYRRKYTLYSVLNAKGKKVWYFRIYLPDVYNPQILNTKSAILKLNPGILTIFNRV